ncbi:Cytochrome c oxidase subunit 5A [Phlyctochytrium planicorne]|nr:Cytochrome c oxidase subunit 5A [Phlyctochytrium planicorne]
MLVRGLTSVARAGISAQARRSASSLTPAALSQLETRWAKLPEAEQGAIADSLAAAQKGDWKKLTLEEKRAGKYHISAVMDRDAVGEEDPVDACPYFIAYGPYGARNPPDPAMKWTVASWTGFFVLISAGLWQWWDTQKPAVVSQNKEWQDARANRQIENKENPYTGPYAAARKQ